MNLKELADAYMKSHNFARLSVSSKRSYIYAANILSDHLGEMDIEKMRRSDFLKFQNELSNKPALANLAIRVASVMFSYALDLDLAASNPVANMRKLKIGSHARWEPEEVAAIIALYDRKISTAVALAWYTGQRESDVLSMRWSDYKDGYITIIQEKTKIEMKIKVHPDLANYLSSLEYESPDEYIVSGKNKMSGAGFRNMLKRRLKNANIDKVFHGIRKGVACSLAENGRPISEIAAIMGHKSMRMAAYYSEQANGKTLRENAVSNLVSVTVP